MLPPFTSESLFIAKKAAPHSLQDDIHFYFSEKYQQLTDIWAVIALGK